MFKSYRFQDGCRAGELWGCKHMCRRHKLTLRVKVRYVVMRPRRRPLTASNSIILVFWAAGASLLER